MCVEYQLLKEKCDFFDLFLMIVNISLQKYGT